MTPTEPVPADPGSRSPAPLPGDAAAPTSPGGTLTLDRRKSIIGGVIALAFLVIVFVTVIPKIGNYGAAWESVQNMTVAGIAVIVAAVLVYLGLYGLPFVAATPGLTQRQGFDVNQSAFAVSNGVPAGAPLGLGLQYAMLNSYGIGPARSTAAITAVGVWSTFVTLGLPILGVLALLIAGRTTTTNVTTGVLGVAVLLILVGLFALILRSEAVAAAVGRFVERLAAPLVRRFRPDARLDISAAILSFRASVVDLVRRRWAAITGAQLLVSLTQFLILYAALQGVSDGQLAPTVLEVFGAFAISQLGLLIPLTPGGLGSVDAAMISLLIAVGVSSGDATAAALVWRAVSYVPQIAVGVISILVWRAGARRRQQALGSAPATSPLG